MGERCVGMRRVRASTWRRLEVGCSGLFCLWDHRSWRIRVPSCRASQQIFTSRESAEIAELVRVLRQPLPSTGLFASRWSKRGERSEGHWSKYFIVFHYPACALCAGWSRCIFFAERRAHSRGLSALSAASCSVSSTAIFKAEISPKMSSLWKFNAVMS